MHVVPRAAGPLAAIAIALAAAAAPAAAERPATIGMGVSGTAEQKFYGSVVFGLPFTIDAGALVQDQLWWHASASFGASEARFIGADHPDLGEGHTFELRSGPRVKHCWERYCVGASLELGWGHARWTFSDSDTERSLDDLNLEARLRVGAALSDNGRVMLEASLGPRVRWYFHSADADGMDDPPPDLLHGGAAGLALVIRN